VEWSTEELRAMEPEERARLLHALYVARKLLRLTVHTVWVRGGYGEIEPSLSHRACSP
jgi:hypothetical protein